MLNIKMLLQCYNGYKQNGWVHVRLRAVFNRVSKKIRQSLWFLVLVLARFEIGREALGGFQLSVVKPKPK